MCPSNPVGPPLASVFCFKTSPPLGWYRTPTARALVWLWFLAKDARKKRTVDRVWQFLVGVPRPLIQSSSLCSHQMNLRALGCDVCFSEKQHQGGKTMTRRMTMDPLRQELGDSSKRARHLRDMCTPLYPIHLDTVWIWTIICCVQMNWFFG